MAQTQYAVIITAAPKPAGFLGKLIGADPQKGVLKAIESVTARGGGQARKMIEKLPRELARFDTEQQARVAAQTLEDAGAKCLVKAVG